MTTLSTPRAPADIALAAPPDSPILPLPVAAGVAYSGWRLTRLAEANARPVYVACKEEDADHAHPALRLVGSQTVLCEGYWPFRPSFAPRRILGGTCLYTAAWAVHFAPAADGRAPRPLSLGLPGDLKRIEKMLKQRRPVMAFQLPTQPGRYHQRLITWQAEVLARFPNLETVHYTLPVHDYHGYIQHFEAALGQALPGLHVALEAYVQTIQAFMEQVWGAQMDKVRFDIPGTPELKKTDASSRENDLQLYLAATHQERVMGMEDLPEVALSHEVARRSGVLIPCAVCVLDLPDPYLIRDDPSYACQGVTRADLQ